MRTVLAKLLVLIAVVAYAAAGVPLQAHAGHTQAAGSGHAAMTHDMGHAMHHDRPAMDEWCAKRHHPSPSGDGAAGHASDECTCAAGMCASVLAIMASPVTVSWDDAAALPVPHVVRLTANTIHPPLRPPRA